MNRDDNVISSLRRHADLVALNLALILVASGAAAYALATHRNALTLYPDWISTKPRLAKAVMGAYAFVDDTRAMARNRLDLSTWFGFQEVVDRSPAALTELDATVGVETDGYVNVLYDVRDSGFAGVRLSNRRDLPSVQFQSTPDGQFVSVRPLDLPDAVAPGRPHHVRLRFDSSRVSVEFDGLAAGSFDRVAGTQRIGFRGGQRHGWVDDVTLRRGDGSASRERFNNSRRLTRNTLLLIGGLTGGWCLLVLALQWWTSTPPRTLGLWIVIANLFLCAIAGSALAVEYLSPRAYQVPVDAKKQAEVRQIAADRIRVLAELQQRYPRPAAVSARRILFLGSSQTWGAGAAAPGDEWVQQLERALNRNDRTPSWQCMNAAISGMTSEQVDDFLDELLTLKPGAAVVNLSSNDVDTAAFHSSLDRIVKKLDGAGIAVVLMLEPNSPERRVDDSPHGDLAVKHAIVAAVAQAHGVPVIDLQGYLAAKNTSGFLWWDFVHLTTFGQRLVAEKLHADLPSLLLYPRSNR